MISLTILNLYKFASFDIGPCDPTKVNNNAFFGFPPWWKYVHTGNYDGVGNCTPTVHFPQGVWAIAFAAVDMLLYLAGIVAVISIVIAGISYITAAGNPDSITSARKRIVNSLIGLAIVLIAAPLVSFIGNRVG
jgi:hypothetical protein